MATWTVKTESRLPALLAKIEKRADGPSSVMVTLATGPGPTRSASQNYKVLQIQRWLGRDPFFVDTDDRRIITAVWRNATKALGLGALEEAARAVGAVFVKLYRDHIDNERSKGREMPPLKRSTLATREKAGQGSVPLRRTDELYNCLTFKVELVK